MLIEQPPLAYRLLFPEALWRIKHKGRRAVYLTFDDGPVAEVTPRVLDCLDRHGVKATFFMVGDNVRRNPEIFEEIRRRGHSWGNHTMHHLQGMKVTTRRYLRDLTEADGLIGSPLFRPPHGLLRWSQAAAIKNHYNIVMYDLVTRDYSRRMTPEKVLENVKRYTRNGSIIVFHDSLKGQRNMIAVLDDAIIWLKKQGYEFHTLPMQ